MYYFNICADGNIGCLLMEYTSVRKHIKKNRPIREKPPREKNQNRIIMVRKVRMIDIEQKTQMDIYHDAGRTYYYASFLMRYNG